MLVVSQEYDEPMALVLPDGRAAVVIVRRGEGRRVRVCVDAPDDVRVLRGGVVEREVGPCPPGEVRRLVEEAYGHG